MGKFLSRLGAVVLEMESASKIRDLTDLKRRCRWVKKYASTLEFQEIVVATKELEQSVIDQDDNASINSKLESLVSIYCRVDLVKA